MGEISLGQKTWHIQVQAGVDRTRTRMCRKQILHDIALEGSQMLNLGLHAEHADTNGH